MEPMSVNQKKLVEAFNNGDNLILSGSAGTGKTYMALSLAIEDTLRKDNKYNKVRRENLIVKSKESFSIKAAGF